MKRLMLLLILLGAPLAGCNLTDATITFECASPDSSSYVKYANDGDTLSLHCFQKANP